MLLLMLALRTKVTSNPIPGKASLIWFEVAPRISLPGLQFTAISMSFTTYMVLDSPCTWFKLSSAQVHWKNISSTLAP